MIMYFMNQEYFNKLVQLGLTEGESKVYLALLEIGSSTVGPVISKSKVAHSNIYEILDRLIEKGIVSYIVKSKTKYFQAASPSNIKLYLDKREKEIHQHKKDFSQLLPELNDLQDNHQKQESEVFIGKKGLRTAYEKLVSGAKKDEEDTFFYIHDKKYAEEADLFYYSIQDILKKVSLRGISDKNGRTSDFLKKVKFISMRYTDFPTPGNIEVCGDKTLIVSWEAPIVGTLIHSSSIANNFRKYFEEVWKQAN